MSLEFSFELRSGPIPAFQNNMRLGLDQPKFVRSSDYSDLEDTLVSEQHLFDFNWRHVNASDLEHVVCTSTIGIPTVGRATVLVPRSKPLATKSRLGFGSVAPVSDRRRRSFDLKLSG